MKRMILLVVSVIVLALAAVVGVQTFYDPGSDAPAVTVTDAAQQIAKGDYLAHAGDCMACHTKRGGAPFAGGRATPTPFGNLY